jgi:hypothetical protein
VSMGATERSNFQQDMEMLSCILSSHESGIITHIKYGDIVVDAGEAKRRSFGLNHIIKQRHDEGRSQEEISALLALIFETLRDGVKTRDIPFPKNPDHKGRMELEKNGIIALVSKQRLQGDNEQWLLTGFNDSRKKEEAADAIKAGIATYCYTPEFLGLGKQVGAAIASLHKVSSEIGKKSS